jgi:hypothetical protein
MPVSKKENDSFSRKLMKTEKKCFTKLTSGREIGRCQTKERKTGAIHLINKNKKASFVNQKLFTRDVFVNKFERFC